ncbi:MAG: Gx transporter family protein [Clostridiales bacterium]|nr:Gx transporter family protein [Clostridiales bacterium]
MKTLLPKTRKGALDSHRITLLAFSVAVALVVAYIESALPPLMPIAPGAKLGLSNVAPLFALIVMGVPDAFIVMALKTLLGAFITGGVSGLMYSVPAGLVSLAIEVMLYKLLFDKTSIAMISLIGAVAFNCVQLVVASLVTGVNLISLLPLLMAAGVLAGAFTGLLTYYIVKKLPYSVYGVQYSSKEITK